MPRWINIVGLLCVLLSQTRVSSANSRNVLSSSVEYTRLRTAEPLMLGALKEYMESEKERLNRFKTKYPHVFVYPPDVSTDWEYEQLKPWQQYMHSEDQRILRLNFWVGLKEEETLNETGAEHHPIKVYHWTKFWSHITWELQENNTANNKFHDFVESLGLQQISEVEVNISAMNIVRVWHAYNLSMESVRNGTIHGVQAAPLDRNDLYRLGVVAQSNERPELALPWLHEALLEHIYDSSDEQYDTIVERIAECQLAHRRLKKEMKTWTIQLCPNMRHLKHIRWYFKKVYTTPRPPSTCSLVKKGDLGDRYHDPDRAHYEQLCRGEIQQRASPELRCRIGNPGDYYSWFKEEIYSDDPYVSLIYDVITDKEAELIKSLAEPELDFARVTGSGYSSEKRTAKTSWMYGSNATVFRQVSERMERMVGLNMCQCIHNDTLECAEPLQVCNYGVGGHFSPHTDAFIQMSEQAPSTRSLVDHLYGQRVATLLLYLNDVEAGGYTVFTTMNITIPPIKNAAAFWYDLYPNGEVDMRTTHAGCPVLFGEKWVANKWIHQYGNWYTRPCGLRPSTTHAELYKHREWAARTHPANVSLQHQIPCPV